MLRTTILLLALVVIAPVRANIPPPPDLKKSEPAAPIVIPDPPAQPVETKPREVRTEVEDDPVQPYDSRPRETPAWQRVQIPIAAGSVSLAIAIGALIGWRMNRKSVQS